MNTQQQTTLNVSMEAAEWLDRLAGDHAGERAAFARWISASPLHVDAFLKVATVDRLLDNVDAQHDIDVERLLAGSARDVIALKNAQGIAVAATAAHCSSPARWRLAAGVAALTGTLALASWWATSVIGGHTFTTTLGEQRTFELPDGSTVNLNTSSEVKVRISDAARDIYLDGQATFKVRHDPQRAFRVHSGDVMVEALGTQFNVDRRPSSTVVTVVEGLVRVSADGIESSLLSVGERARIVRRKPVEKMTMAQSPGQQNLHGTRLVFADDRLDDIAAEFNRWNRRQIEVEDRTLAARLYSGAFDAGDPESLISFLERQNDIGIERDIDKVVIRPRQ